MPPISSIATSPAIDLSELPPPVLVPQPDFEARLAAKIARLIVSMPEFDALVESDPAMKLLEADSYDELLIAQQCNDAARQMLLAFATGANLDNLGALYGVARLEITPANPVTGAPAVMESDTELRGRILLAPHSFSVAGPELAYVYFAKSASGDVLDASATSPTPGQVVVSVLSRTGDGSAPGGTLAAVTAMLTADAVRPLTDEVIVQSADVVDFTIAADLYLYAGPDPTLIETTAESSLNAYLAKARRLGRDIPRSAIIAALHVAGVQRVALTSPAVDQVMTPLQAGWCTGINLNYAGVAE
ncbi:MAG: baseplate J/gp47 family protein [Proteobacteria bacterium]|nr:baseplate J/gp47 family protein [Pseudomonadota bacterium]